MISFLLIIYLYYFYLIIKLNFSFIFNFCILIDKFYIILISLKNNFHFQMMVVFPTIQVFATNL
jgi:hypothetical protein